MDKPKKHRHKYEKIVEWIRSPSHPDDASRYWNFSVKRGCACGASYVDDANLSEVEEFIKDSTCTGCGSMGKEHESPADCIRDLNLRVRFLEDRLEKVCDVLSGVK